ncbi:MAG: PepSY domain-containing protein [Pseudomonadota bacterium]|jgi:hypothetical protein
MIEKTEAIAAARAFVEARNPDEWIGASIVTSTGQIGDRTVWIIEVTPPPVEWTEIDWKPMRYFVDATTGRIAGFATERSQTLFNA